MKRTTLIVYDVDGTQVSLLRDASGYIINVLDIGGGVLSIRATGYEAARERFESEVSRVLRGGEVVA